MKKNKLFGKLGFNGIDSFISWGASIVIVGLMFKILHWSGGEFMIALGLIVEAALFLLLGFVKTDEYNGVDPDYILGEHKYIEMLNIIEEFEQCKKELSKLTKNIETMNSVYDGVIDSIKTNVNK